MHTINKIIVVFKTHLDVGFTGLAADIVKSYNETHIPRALSVGEEIQKMGRSEGFVWTTGSWLIHQYLQQANESQKKQMLHAIEAGTISWHGLPFTLHSEFANEDLYRYGLSLHQELDQRFGKKTIAAKNTDVPGHTRAIVPLLHDSGIEFLHIGVNPASTAPEIPDLFYWKDIASDKKIIVMYNSGYYGEFTHIPQSDTAICFAHTNDNAGPQKVDDILTIYDELHKKYPHADIVAGDLNDVATAVLQIADTLPTITQEIGDTWIHGVGTDPKKTSQFRSLLRLATDFDDDNKRKVYDPLLFIPEHTWGLDEKTFLNDHNHFERNSFLSVKQSELYRKMEQSWEEQRDYVNQAVDALEGHNKKRAQECIAEFQSPYPILTDYTHLEERTSKINGWEIEINDQGAIVRLENESINLADSTHPLGLFHYEVFSEEEVKAFGTRYMSDNPDWALEDFGKIGLSSAVDEYYSAQSTQSALYSNDTEWLIALHMDEKASGEYGCPSKLFLKIKPTKTEVTFDFSWFDKPANRIPEALWLGFCFKEPLTAIHKLNSWIDPLDVVVSGNREMHATEGHLQFNHISLHTLDAPLLAVGTPAVYHFYNQQPAVEKGVWINLFNNQWGTNFPMWNEGNARFRFSVTY